MIDLGALDLDRRLELLFGAHDRVRRHLAEVPREHRVAAAFLDLLVGRGAARRQRRRALGRPVDRRHLEVEFFFDELDLCSRGTRADRRRLAVEVVVLGRLGGLGLLLGVHAAAGRGLGPVAARAAHRMERGVAAAPFVAGDRGRTALALAHDRCFLARERVGGLGGSLR